MKRALFLLILSSTIVASCGQSANEGNNQAAAQPQQPKKRAPYCFFKPDELKGWAAKRGKDGTITVNGKGHVKDPRYKAIFAPPTTSGTTILIAPTITPNTGYEAPGDWWDMSAAIPNSAGLDEVQISCGDKQEAKFVLKRKS